MKAKRVFIGPHEIAGYYANLARGFREIGVDCDYITHTPHPAGYGGETCTPALLRLARFFNNFRGKQNRPIIIKALIALPGELLLGVWSIFAILKYDIFIFGFGHSLMPRKNWDLKLLKWLGKTVISNLSHGSEARPPCINGFFQAPDGETYPVIEDIYSRTRLSAERVRRVQHCSSLVIGAPFSTTHFSSNSLVNCFALGIPFGSSNPPDSMTDGSLLDPLNEHKHNIRILHSPSNPAAKGSKLILKAIKNLRNKGYKIDFVLLHGKPHVEVIREIQQCDFIVDQVYSDTPLAGFATEAAWFGKPAVVGGYAFDYLKTLVPEGMWPPSKTCHPDGIEQAIDDLIVNCQERLKLGAEAQKFVREKWNSAEVARRYLRLIEGGTPEDWWLDPQTVSYLEGAGQSEERSKENIRKMVEQYGVESLQLSQRPDLERAFLEFACVKNTD